MAYTKTISCIVTTTIKNKLKNDSIKCGFSISEMIRRIITQYYEDDYENIMNLNYTTKDVDDEPIIEELVTDAFESIDDKTIEVLRIEVSTTLKDRIYKYLRYKNWTINFFTKIVFIDYLNRHPIPGVKNFKSNRC